MWVAGVCLPSPLPPVKGIAGVCPHLLRVVLVSIFHSSLWYSLLPSAHLQRLHSLPHIGLVSSLYMLKPPQSSLSQTFSTNNPNKPGFQAPNGWFHKTLTRKNLSLQRATSVGQVPHHPNEVLDEFLEDFFRFSKSSHAINKR